VNLSAPQFTLIALAIALGLVTVARFEWFCLKDLAQTSDEELRYLSRTGWIVVIAFSIPIGGILYLYYGRPR
jgi:hypothetical protein